MINHNAGGWRLALPSRTPRRTVRRPGAAPIFTARLEREGVCASFFASRRFGLLSVLVQFFVQLVSGLILSPFVFGRPGRAYLSFGV